MPKAVGALIAYLSGTWISAPLLLNALIMLIINYIIFYYIYNSKVTFYYYIIIIVNYILYILVLQLLIILARNGLQANACYSSLTFVTPAYYIK